MKHCLTAADNLKVMKYDRTLGVPLNCLHSHCSYQQNFGLYEPAKISLRPVATSSQQIGNQFPKKKASKISKPDIFLSKRQRTYKCESIKHVNQMSCFPINNENIKIIIQSNSMNQQIPRQVDASLNEGTLHTFQQPPPSPLSPTLNSVDKTPTSNNIKKETPTTPCPSFCQQSTIYQFNKFHYIHSAVQPVPL